MRRAECSDPREDPVWVWLETEGPRQTEFLREQATRTDACFKQLKLREYFADRIDDLLDQPRYELVGGDGKYVYAIRRGGEADGALIRASHAAGLDVGEIFYGDDLPDGASISSWELSADGYWVCCTIAHRGLWAEELHVVDSSTGALVDVVQGVRGSRVYCPPKSSMVIYLRGVSSGSGEYGVSKTRVCIHEIGDHKHDRVLVASSADDSRALRLLGGSGSFVVLAFDRGPKTPNDLFVVDIESPSSSPRLLLSSMLGQHRFLGVSNQECLAITSWGANRNRVVAVDLLTSVAREVVPEDDRATLLKGAVGKSCIALKYALGAEQGISVVDHTSGRIIIPPTMTVQSISHLGAQRGEDTFFAVCSEVGRRPHVQVISPHALGSSPTVEACPRLDLTSTVLTAVSRDGVEVDVQVFTRGEGPKPLILYAYGGFGVALRAGFSPMFYPWLESGGSLAVAQIRGGGEKGRSWHQSAVKRFRHRSFEDLFAAAEVLIEQGYSTSQMLVMHGRSNGGLLAAVALTQRPDLWAAILPTAGIYDMLRFLGSGVGEAWLEEFGDPYNERDAEYLRTYSPVHNVRSGIAYPPVLVSVGGQDERVAAWHSYKLVAALQDAQRGNECQTLLLADPAAGHGFGASRSEMVAELSCQLAFAAHHAGLIVADAGQFRGAED